MSLDGAVSGGLNGERGSPLAGVAGELLQFEEWVWQDADFIGCSSLCCREAVKWTDAQTPGNGLHAIFDNELNDFIGCSIEVEKIQGVIGLVRRTHACGISCADPRR